MKIIHTELPGVIVFEPKIFQDSRGYFTELFRQARYEAAGLNLPFVQDNLSLSSKGTLRGLHYQLPHAQGKLVTVMQGSVQDIVVDIRQGSPTFGKSLSFLLDAKTHRQVYIPPGFAHGFCTLENNTLFLYKCTDTYHPEAEKGILWSDPNLNIAWALSGTPALSPKDSTYPHLSEVPSHLLPHYEERT